MIEIDSLSVGYGDSDVLRDVSLSVRAGEMVGLLGPNGSGKTTLLFAAAGVLPIRAGSIRIAGESIAEKSARDMARLIATVPQRSEVSFSFTALAVTLMGRYPHLDGWGGYAHTDVKAALEALAEVGVLHLAQRPIGELSGGEAQLVMVARALAQRTEILFLDEATSSLDAARKIRVFDLMTAKNAEGATLVCVLHDLNLAALYCRRLIFLKNGGVYADGPTEEVFTDRTLSEIYETDVRVSRHPVVGAPQAHFVPGGSGDVLTIGDRVAGSGRV